MPPYTKYKAAGGLLERWDVGIISDMVGILLGINRDIIYEDDKLAERISRLSG